MVKLEFVARLNDWKPVLVNEKWAGLMNRLKSLTIMLSVFSYGRLTP